MDPILADAGEEGRLWCVNYHHGVAILTCPTIKFILTNLPNAVTLSEI